MAEELERRRDSASARVRALEGRIDGHAHRGEPSEASTLDDCSELAADLEAVWWSPEGDARLMKRVVRTLIDEVIADVDASSAEIVLHIHWRGGVHTEQRVPRRRRGKMTHTSKDVVAAVRGLARLCTDDVIASVLNRNGLRNGRGKRWTRERVVSLRSWHEISCHSSERCGEGWLKLNEAAALLGVSPRTLRLAVERGEIAGPITLAEGPWVINRQALWTVAVEELVQRTRGRARNPAKPSPGQQTLGFSGT